ncbi:DUF5996 family protein [Mucilaginibacter arboris]|uniref:Ava_C0101 and related proteins n=1 Tax=Mucilaginibacter arboris TaxID=2682090 RepID=A0A7K1SXB4_9SPHI|nr:DUF5996 family protein [Mucilaginibacter arboris]MVN21680.1 hypothetical protein [Mucilaginibacter arboris]
MKKEQQIWPELKFEELKETVATVQLWTQIVGKIRLSKTPWINHSWHVTLYVSAKGLTTGSIPYEGGIFQIDFDFIYHKLIINSSWNESVSFDLKPRSVANFYQELLEKLELIGIHINIYAVPNEVEPAIPFQEDEIHHAYNKEQMNKLWQALIKTYNVFTRFRTGFVGKCSPVHLFWGAFDLAVTRFSGRKAPLHPGGSPNIPLKVMQEAYSHEVSSCGFWPGNESFPQPVFYAYCYPTNASFSTQKVGPPEAFYSEEMGEFFLPYEVVRSAPDPESVLLRFLQTTYEAAAITGNWDREALECDLSSFNKSST